MVTIKSSREIDLAFSGGRRYSTPLLVALVHSTPEGRGPRGRVAFIAGKRLGNAVQRNRCKRVLRAAVARASGPWEGYDVVLMAKLGIAHADAAAVDRDLNTALKRAGLVQ